ncbi:MAG TPA: hypothetical protein VF026_21630 [Ktedonobacteraceae bacterium]
MNTSNDKCKQLRELYDRLEAEVRTLKESEQEEEREGVANPLEMASIIKSLQKTLSDVDLELQKCLDSN